jgi:hypothetical protein
MCLVRETTAFRRMEMQAKSTNGNGNYESELAILAMYWSVKAKEAQELVDLAEYVLEAEKLIGMPSNRLDELKLKVKSLSKMAEECKRIAEALSI